MKKIDITKLSVEYYPISKKYYRVIYDDTKSKREISKQTAMNWIKKGVSLYEWREYNDWRDYMPQISLFDYYKKTKKEKENE